MGISQTNTSLHTAPASDQYYKEVQIAYLRPCTPRGRQGKYSQSTLFL